MSGWDLTESQGKVLDIWIEIRPRDEEEIIHPRSTISTAADTLIAYLTSPLKAQDDEFDDFSNRFAKLEQALIEFCLLYPRSIDWGITVFFDVIRNIPKDAPCELGTGPKGARLDLERFLGDFTNLYVGGTMPKVGMEPACPLDAKDQSAVHFSSAEVKERTEDVIEKMKNLRKRRWKTLITLYFSARCHALESPTRPNNKYLDQQFLFFSDQFYLESFGWTRINCISILTMLRGSASYLLSAVPQESREGTRQRCIDNLRIWLLTSGEGREAGDKADDFHIKAHAAVSYNF